MKTIKNTLFAFSLLLMASFAFSQESKKHVLEANTTIEQVLKTEFVTYFGEEDKKKETPKRRERGKTIKF